MRSKSARSVIMSESSGRQCASAIQSRSDKSQNSVLLANLYFAHRRHNAINTKQTSFIMAQHEQMSEKQLNGKSIDLSIFYALRMEWK